MVDPGKGRGRRRPIRAAGRMAGGLARTLVKLALVIAFVGTGLLIGGFAQFATTVTEAQRPAVLPQSEAIVVLTGGSERIDEALDLLARDTDRRLLISGVNPRTRVEDLAEVHEGHATLIRCCSELDTVSSDTISNAVETRKWMAARGYGSLVLVTSAYHMPRSRMEFARQMPGITVHAWPVPLTGLEPGEWWKRPDTLRLMVSEYVKYVGAWSRDFVQPGVFDSVRASLFGKVD